MQNKETQTRDPALTKTRIDGDHNDHTHDSIADTILGHDEATKGTETLQETVIGTRYASDNIDHGAHTHEEIHHNNHNVMSTDESIENHTTINKGINNKGTNTFQESVVGSEHVNANDNPDRRDQDGNAFDDGINEHTIASDVSKSEDINNMNRYANVDNAQTRVLNPDEKD